MKISCDSCGAKYTIADAKVQGRKVKVRCKSCKATILVDGNASADGGDDVSASDPPAAMAMAAAPASAATGTPKPGTVKKDAWSVNLSDDDSRDMTTAEIIAGWKSGLVTQDAYAWKDGMSDWKPVLEIPELKQKLLAAKPLKPEPVLSSAKLPPSPAKASSAGTDDLFGGVDLAGSEHDVGGPAARPAPKAAAGTGARNESSVLFSLDSLTGGGAPTAPSAGGVDIFGGLGGGGMLATNTDLLTAPAKEPPPAPVFKHASVRPVAGGDKKSSMPIVFAILAAAVVVGGVLFFVMGGKDEAAAVDPAAASMAAELEKTKAALEKSKADEEAAKKKAEEAAKAAEAEAAKAKAAADAGKTPEAGKPADPAAATGTPAATGSTPAGSSTTPSTTATKPAAPSGGGSFDVGAAKAALAGAAASAAGCGNASGPKGSGKVQVTFAPSGRVTSANVVAGPFGGTSVGGCVASKFRAARVPAFSGSPQTVSKSFTVN
jgi:predicted Zn finger-like uncharacterized protein